MNEQSNDMKQFNDRAAKVAVFVALVCISAILIACTVWFVRFILGF